MDIGDIKGKYFIAADMADLSLGTADVAIDVTVSVDGTEIYAESIYPEADGSVFLRDLYGLIKPYLPTSGVASIDITAGSRSAKVKALVCAQSGHDWQELDAQEWMQSHFLNTVGDKAVGEAAKELLYVISPGEKLTSCPVDVEARYLTDNGTWQEVSFILTTITAKADVVQSVVASPSTVLAAVQNIDPTAQRLSGYFVSVGNRKARFLIDHRRTPYCASFSFLNAFGLRERLSLYGESVAKRSYTYTNAAVGGELKAVDPKVEIAHTVTTPVTSESDEELLTEMLASENVQVYTAHGWCNVVFTEADYEPSAAFDAINEAKFTYRLAQNNHRFSITEAGGSRVFGAEFDESFE